MFYYLLAGTSEEERTLFHLKKPEEYHYLNQVRPDTAACTPSVTLFTTGINNNLRWSNHKWSAETHYHWHLVLTCVSCDHLQLNFIEGRVSDFMTTYITYYVSASLHVDVRLTEDVPVKSCAHFCVGFSKFSNCLNVFSSSLSVELAATVDSYFVVHCPGCIKTHGQGHVRFSTSWGFWEIHCLHMELSNVHIWINILGV